MCADHDLIGTSRDSRAGIDAGSTTGLDDLRTGFLENLEISAPNAIVTRLLGTKLNVDNNRVYAAGFSAGAGMANLLGAELSGDLAAIAVIEGAIGFRQPDGSYAKTPDPIGPIAVVIFHGKNDQLLPYDGGQGANNYTTSVADEVKFWTTADKCKGNPEKENLADGNTVTKYSKCDSDTEVVLYTILKGGHEWPTLDGHAKLSATDAIWDFFSQHPKAIAK